MKFYQYFKFKTKNYNKIKKKRKQIKKTKMDLNALIESITNSKLLPELTIKKICRKVKSLLFE